MLQIGSDDVVFNCRRAATMIVYNDDRL